MSIARNFKWVSLLILLLLAASGRVVASAPDTDSADELRQLQASLLQRFVSAKHQLLRQLDSGRASRHEIGAALEGMEAVLNDLVRLGSGWDAFRQIWAGKLQGLRDDQGALRHQVENLGAELARNRDSLVRTTQENRRLLLANEYLAARNRALEALARAKGASDPELEKALNQPLPQDKKS